ncbi:MAG TPA: pyridoxal phosphate-dependent aminotransferase [Kiritimatiellae bacterium]|nr:pyridoxal phosphate-dependent aminotransferase [Kiritimatiellia bacterium]
MAASADRFNPRTGNIPASATLEISARVRKLRAGGRQVLALTAGEPDFDTPEPIKEAAIAALRSGITKYSPVAGYPELREAICRKLHRENGLEYDPSQIVVSNGAKHSLSNVISVLVRDGDEVLIPSPYWLSYPAMVRIAGGVCRFIETDSRTRFKLTAEALQSAVSPRSRVLILNSPANPTGAVYTRTELEALAEVILERGLTVISDEVYEKIVFEGSVHYSIASLGGEIKKRTVVVNGFSKTFAMTGWRLGYLAAEKDIAQAVANLQSQSTSGPNSFAQYGAMAALKLPAAIVSSMVKAYSRRRQILIRALGNAARVGLLPPEGSFYGWVDVSATGLPATDFCIRLLEEKDTAVIPGEPFGGPQHVRLSFACDDRTLREGCTRLMALCQELTG